MATTVSETVMSSVPQIETVTMKLQNKGPHNMNPHPPPGPKPKGKLMLDPQRALEPARKKLSTLESERIMAVLIETIKRTQLVAALPFIMDNLDRFNVLLGTELLKMLEDHKVIIQSFEELKSEADRMRQKELDAQAEKEALNEENPDEQGEDGQSGNMESRPSTGMSMTSQAENAMRNLLLVARQMQHSCKNILRAFSRNPSTMTAVLKEWHQQSEGAQELFEQMEEMKNILMNMLLTTPVEEEERNQFLKEISERERYNSGVITKLEGELQAALDDKENEIRKKNDVIRRLQADLHQIEKFSEEHIRRTKSEAEKQESADTKNSEGKKLKLQQELAQLNTQLQNHIQEHREHEQSLRRRKFQIETEVENWIQKYDQDMGERQDEFEEIDAVYTEEKKQLNELEERFKTLEAEYNQIQEERRIARERREAAERELQISVMAATTIQAFWRSFKVRKALKGKKKKKGGKKGKK